MSPKGEIFCLQNASVQHWSTEGIVSEEIVKSRRYCLELRESHSGSANSNRESVMISLSDKGSVGGRGTRMGSREDRRRIADPYTIVHAIEHKSIRACTEAYNGGQCAYSY